MQIRFARYQDNVKGVVIAYGLAIGIGAIAALSGAAAAGLFLFAAFILLIWYGAAVVKAGHGRAEFEDRELTGQEYQALESRLRMYPELTEKVGAMLPDTKVITYADAYHLEDLINTRVEEVQAAKDEQMRQAAKASLFSKGR